MSYILIVTIAIVIFSLIFDFINGFHDTANAVATAVSTRALTPRRAYFISSSHDFIGALTFTGVAGTITKDIVDPFKLQHGLVVVLAAIAAIIWNLITWLYGIPSSSSHALIGSIAGAAICIARFVCSITLSRFYKNYYRINHLTNYSFCVGYMMYTIVKIVLKIQI